MDSYFGQKQQFEVKNLLRINLFLRNTQLFSSQGINWWTGVMSIACGLLWCFYQLFELILMAPIHCRGSIGEQVIYLLNYSFEFKSLILRRWNVSSPCRSHDTQYIYSFQLTQSTWSVKSSYKRLNICKDDKTFTTQYANIATILDYR